MIEIPSDRVVDPRGARAAASLFVVQMEKAIVDADQPRGRRIRIAHFQEFIGTGSWIVQRGSLP
jgi:hypothetical protein